MGAVRYVRSVNVNIITTLHRYVNRNIPTGIKRTLMDPGILAECYYTMNVTQMICTKDLRINLNLGVKQVITRWGGGIHINILQVI